MSEENITALKHLKKDFEMLKDGSWIPDDASCQASIDAIDNILEQY